LDKEKFGFGVKSEIQEERTESWGKGKEMRLMPEKVKVEVEERIVGERNKKKKKKKKLSREERRLKN
jgi:hypothetical protein